MTRMIGVMTRSCNVFAWSLTGEMSLFRAQLLLKHFSKEISVHGKSTCCDYENIIHLPRLLSENRYCAISTRSIMYKTSFRTLNSLFLCPLFLQRTLEFHQPWSLPQSIYMLRYFFIYKQKLSINNKSNKWSKFCKTSSLP